MEELLWGVESALGNDLKRRLGAQALDPGEEAGAVWAFCAAWVGAGAVHASAPCWHLFDFD